MSAAGTAAAAPLEYIAIGERMKEIVAQKPDAPAITSQDVTRTWAQLHRRTNRMARAASSKAVVGESVPIRATVWREGHDAVAANVVWKRLGAQGPGQHSRMVAEGVDSDRWATSVVPDEPGLWTFRVDAWSDPWSTWLHTIHAKVDAGQDARELINDLETGARLIERVGRRPGERANRELLFGAAAALRDTTLSLPERLLAALSEPVDKILTERPIRELLTRARG